MYINSVSLNVAYQVMCVFVFPASEKLGYAFLCALRLQPYSAEASQQSLTGLLIARRSRQVKLVYVIRLFVMHYEILLH